nr:MAG TPA: hypothetical protein [Caudoviricetes sp.]
MLSSCILIWALKAFAKLFIAFIKLSSYTFFIVKIITHSLFLRMTDYNIRWLLSLCYTLIRIYQY